MTVEGKIEFDKDCLTISSGDKKIVFAKLRETFLNVQIHEQYGTKDELVSTYALGKASQLCVQAFFTAKNGDIL